MIKNKFIKKFAAVLSMLGVVFSYGTVFAASDDIKTVYSASADFSGVQGKECWSYQIKASGEYIDLKFDGDTKWSGDLVDNTKYAGTYITKAGSMHPGNNVNTARVWTAPMAGIVRLTSLDNVKKTNNKGDGLTAMIIKDGKEIWKYVLKGTDTTGSDYSIETEVKAGDKIYFEITTEKVAYCDTHWVPVVTYLQAGRFSSESSAITDVKDMKSDLSIDLYDTKITDNGGFAYLAIYDSSECLRALSSKEKLTFKSGNTYSVSIDSIPEGDDENGYEGWRAELILLTNVVDGETVERVFPIDISDAIVLK